MSSGHIVERNGSFRVMVYAGRDPVTGRKRYVTRTVRGNRKDAERVRNQMLVDGIGGTVLRGRSGSTRRSVWCQTVPWEGVRSGQRGMIVFAMTGPLAGTNPIARKP